MKMALILKKLANEGLTKFQIEVLLATLKIPKGRTATYKEIARMAGYPRAYRAVGTSLRKNPLPIIIPCHRVIRSDGSLGKYSGRYGSRKAELLKKEGAIK